MRRLVLGAVFLAGCNALFGIDAASEGLFDDAGAGDAGTEEDGGEDAPVREDAVSPPPDAVADAGADADTGPRPLGTCIVMSSPTFYVNRPSDLARFFRRVSRGGVSAPDQIVALQAALIAREPEHGVVALAVFALDGGLLASTTASGTGDAGVLFPRVAVDEGAEPRIIVSWTERNGSKDFAKVRFYDRDLVPRSDVIPLGGQVVFNPNAVAVVPRGDAGGPDEFAVFRYIGEQQSATLDIIRCTGL